MFKVVLMLVGDNEKARPTAFILRGTLLTLPPVQRTQVAPEVP